MDFRLHLESQPMIVIRRWLMTQITWLFTHDWNSGDTKAPWEQPLQKYLSDLAREMTSVLMVIRIRQSSINPTRILKSSWTTTGRNSTALMMMLGLVAITSQPKSHTCRFILWSVILLRERHARATRRFKTGWNESSWSRLQIRSGSIKDYMKTRRSPVSRYSHGLRLTHQDVSNSSMRLQTLSSSCKTRTCSSWACFLNKRKRSSKYIILENDRMSTRIEDTG